MRTLYIPALVRLSIFAVLGLASAVHGDEFSIGKHGFTVPDGFTVERIAGPPLVDRPICADFDAQGRLYIADSSGSNDPVADQVKNPTHRIVRLVDQDGDGVFDESTVFADRMMFPEGTLWHDGSLYVAAPPSIWKLTDTDGDGVADVREEWWQGKTLTPCANDLHGPYLGRDGWIYWCKGAYAEQRYERPGKTPFVTRASHIFRCRVDAPRDPQTGSVLSSAVEPVMTGGMANPVDVVFTNSGERIFSTTFLTYPRAGKRDGLIHAIYGGVYGQDLTSYLAGHPRTGKLLPPLEHMGAAAPCGLTSYQSGSFGADYQGNLFTCLFNMRKVTRHTLSIAGATYETKTEDFLVSDHMDFHPTDVIEDADGSLVVIDTGGWYKLCCPTSQLEKPDILGAVYRVKRKHQRFSSDARGSKIPWDTLSVRELVDRLRDSRFTVRERAIRRLAKLRDQSVPQLTNVLASTAESTVTRNAAVWALTQNDHPEARSAVVHALNAKDPILRQAGIHSVAVHRDASLDVEQQLLWILSHGTPHEKRASAEALGRLGKSRFIPALVAAAAQTNDRMVEHSCLYALIEIDAPDVTRKHLLSKNPRQISVALVALDQMESGRLQPEEALHYLDSPEHRLQQTIEWILDQHLDWAEPVSARLHDGMQRLSHLSGREKRLLDSRLARFAEADPVADMLAGFLDSRSDAGAIDCAVQAMTKSSRKHLPASWLKPVTELLRSGQFKERSMIALLVSKQVPKNSADELVEELAKIAEKETETTELRLAAFWAIKDNIDSLRDAAFQFLLDNSVSTTSMPRRSRVIEILATVALTEPQRLDLAQKIPGISPLDINRLLAAFLDTRSTRVGTTLLDSLAKFPASRALDLSLLERVFHDYPIELKQRFMEFKRTLAANDEKQLQRLRHVLSTLPEGDARRGQEVFHSSKAACISCHAVGYLGGRVGPDLTRIARVRERRDLLESVLFPSASIVQNYESILVILDDGTSVNGITQSESDQELVLTVGADSEKRIPQSEIAARKRSQTSVMPAGLDEQLTEQQLADLVEFLMTRK